MSKTPAERAARVERMHEKCARRSGGSMADVTTLRNDVRAMYAEYDRVKTELDARIAAESADAAAGSYAGRAEEAEAKLVVAESMRAWLGTEATKLLAEREAAMAYAREVEAKRDVATARAEQAEAALAEMRERLGNLKPAGMQYRANGPHVHGVTEGNVRDYFTNQWVEGYWPEGRQLYAGPWQRIEELRDDDDAPRTALERTADEQGDGEGGGHTERPGP